MVGPPSCMQMQDGGFCLLCAIFVILILLGTLRAVSAIEQNLNNGIMRTTIILILLSILIFSLFLLVALKG